MRGLSLKLALLLWLLASPLYSKTSISAAAEQLCFPGVAGIRDCISGRFLGYWRDNGGLAVFGYPLTPAREEQTDEGVFLTQYFERQRFELHPENPAPYDVLLGRLGAELFERTHGDWRALPAGQAAAGCLFFDQTQRSVCPPFAGYWQSHGLLDPALDAPARSLALLGLPLTQPRMERNPDGDLVMTQWFERARLEDHGLKGVLLGRLGAEIRGGQPAPAPAPDQSAAAELIDWINRERASQGLAPLARDSRLDSAAQAHSADMARTDSVSHIGSDGSKVADRIARAGYGASKWAENIAAGPSDAVSVFSAWMQNDGHRRNILNPELRDIGVGVVHNPNSAYGWYWTAVFAAP